ncbi:hypothetical protein HYDPIDRAFT_83692 [Hydnomerulius pinastri MD-312]|nr:hypothetical protein HYDPIDRAFT_83692 [Hydnomerulius pinastri MD-312]
MRFFKNFRLLHRRTKSEGDVSGLIPKSPAQEVKHSNSAPLALYDKITPERYSGNVTAPVFLPLEMSLPSFDPCAELYLLEPARTATSPTINAVTTLSEHFMDLETKLAHLREEKASLEQDLVDYRTDVLNTRSELYSEMLKSARYQQQTIEDFHKIQKIEARYHRFCNLFVDIGIPQTAVDMISRVLESGNGNADDLLVDAIRDASNDENTLLARLKPIVTNDRTPEHYQSALDMALNVRKEVKSHKKLSKFWKKLAQEDARHANTITPSPSAISSIREDLTPERQSALNALIARRRTARYSESRDGDVFGGQHRESSLDILASSLASSPRVHLQDPSRLSASISSSTAASSTSTAHLSYLAGLSPLPRLGEHLTDTPSLSARPSSRLSTSLRHSSRSSSQSLVLGSVDLNVSRASSVGATEPHPTEEEEGNHDADPVSTVTLSQDLVQNLDRASLGRGHRRIPSAATQRSTRANSSSFRLSMASPVRSLTAAISEAFPVLDTPALRTPDMRLSEIEPIEYTPTSSEVGDQGTSFDNSVFHSLLYGGNTASTPSDVQLSPTDTQVNSTLDSVSKSGATSNRDSRFLEHVNEYSRGSLLVLEASASTSTAASNDLAGTNGESKDSLFATSKGSPPSGPTTPSKTPPGPRSTPSKTGRSMLPVLSRFRRLSSSSSSSPESLMNKLRGLTSPSRSPKWGRSPDSSGCASGSENASPVKGSAIPVLQRRMTIRARRLSVARKF